MGRFKESDLKGMGLSQNADGSWSRQPSKMARDVQKAIQQMHDTPATFHVNPQVEINSIARPIMVFETNPMGAPRMTRSDQWKTDPHHKDTNKRQRPEVARYFAFKDSLRQQALTTGFVLPDSGFQIFFHVQMPHSWSQKKRNQMRGTPHQQKPDTDNMVKAVKDALCENDAHIWDYRITKLWADAGKIVIYKL